MEFLNQIELKGIIQGVRTINIGKLKSSTFALRTEQAYKSDDSSAYVDVTWFKCSAFEGKEISNLGDLKDGMAVHVVGRMKNERYMDSEGNEKTLYAVICRTLEIIK